MSVDASLLTFDHTYFYFIIERPPFQQVQDHVEGVLRLVNFVQPDDRWVVQFTHELNFILNRILTVLLRISNLFWEGLDRKTASVLQAVGQVNRSEVPLADFLVRLETLMELPLVDLLS